MNKDTILSMVQNAIAEVGYLSDSFDSFENYTSEINPLLTVLKEIESEIKDEQRSRMVSDTGYEIKHAIHVGDKEILFAVDERAADGMAYFVGNYTQNEIIGEYSGCQVCDDFLEAMEEFTGRVNQQIEAVREEVKEVDLPTNIFSPEYCFPNDYTQSIDGKIVAIKAEVLRPEYRRGDVQLVLVDGGFGANANARGRTVSCYHLNTGQHTRFERSDVLGEVKPECLPQWAKDNATAILADKASEKKQRNKEAR